jgi:uncharacterized integral membrane protein
VDSKLRHWASQCRIVRHPGNVQGLRRAVASGPRPRSRGLGLAAVAGGLVLAFIVLNTQQVSVDWIVTTTKTPLIVVILISLVVGGIFVATAFAKRKRSADRKRRAARGQRSRPLDQ